jgi:DNA-binding CsgD family transcriptional regulator/pimeloyl-ACP methyl ester carboxylesterase
MDDPPVRYVTTADGVSIAYWTLGQGQPLVCLPALPHSHIWMEWEQPEWRRGYELAAAAARVVRYDGRGTGLSQRDVQDFSLDALVADLDAVVGELGAEEVILHGAVNSCPVAIAYAVRYPERVSHLILWIPVVDGSVHLANPMLQAARQIVMTDWMTFSETVAHGLLGWGEPEAARRFAELVRAGIDQHTILPMVEQLHAINVWDLLPKVQCPTLLLHRPALPMLPPGMAEAIAARIPNAQLALFEGSASAPFIGDWRAITRAIDSFLGLKLGDGTRKSRGRALRLLTMKNESLSPREREVVALVVQGLTNREIADELFLAEKTVENHMGRILVKLDLRSRTQLAAYAVEHGLTSKPA